MYHYKLSYRKVDLSLAPDTTSGSLLTRYFCGDRASECQRYHCIFCGPSWNIRHRRWASYQIRKIAGCACAGNARNVFSRRRIQRKTQVSDPGMHHGTCVMHVPWCMSGLLTRGGGENVPCIPGACAPAIMRIWQEAHGVCGNIREEHGTGIFVGWWYSPLILGLYSLSGKTSYRKISWSLEAARFGFKLFQSLWNLAGTSAALLPRYLSNFRAMRPLQHPISRLRDFTRFGGKTAYRLVNRGPGGLFPKWMISWLDHKSARPLGGGGGFHEINFFWGVWGLFH